MKRIAVIGLGQIGGSLVLAMRKSKINASIIGIDPSIRRRRLLKQHLNESSAEWKTADSAELIFLCLHFKPLRKYLLNSKNDALLVDVCSAKELVIEIANKRRLRMIGGHPMAGNEHQGERGWNPDLFRKAPFFLCPAGKSNSTDRINISRLLRKIGSKPIIIDPVKHDQAVAVTSHLPAILAHSYSKLANRIPREFLGPGFHSFMRPGQCSNELLETFRQSNEKNIRKAAVRLKRQLTSL